MADQMADKTRRFAVGAGWLYSYRWLERLLDFVALLVLARLLAPEDFGLVAIAASVGAIVEGLAAFDVSKALIQRREADRALYDTAWTLSTLRGLVAALAMVAVAPFLTDARLSAVLYALALSPLLQGLANPRFVDFEKNLVYSRLAALTLGARIVSFAVTLALALLHRSYWALVFGLLAGALVSLVLSYALKPFRPRFSLARFADLFAFTGWLSLTSVVTTLSMETDKLIVGRLLGIADAGRYFMTQRVGVLPTRELISPLQRLLFPSFSEIAHDRERLRRVAVESINVLGALSLPAGCGFALVAGEFVPLVLGERWLALVPLLTLFVPYLGLRATLSMALPCVLALGRTRLLFWVSFAYALVHLPAFIAGTVFFGLPGTIGSLVAAGGVYIALNAWLLHRTLGIRPAEIGGQLLRPLLAVGLMVGAVLGLEVLVAEEGWQLLILKIALGAGVYGGSLFALWRLQGRPPGVEERLLRLLRLLRPR